MSSLIRPSQVLAARRFHELSGAGLDEMPCCIHRIACHHGWVVVGGQSKATMGLDYAEVWTRRYVGHYVLHIVENEVK